MNTKKDEIINIVIEYAKTHEIANLTVSEIAEISSITRRTLYRHFDNKSILLFDVFETCILNLNSDILKKRKEYFSKNENLSAKDKIYYGLKAIIESSMENTHYVKIIVECDSILKNNENLRHDFRKVVEKMDYIIGLLNLAQTSGELREDIDTEQLAFLIYDTFLGLVYRNIITRDKYDDKLNPENVYQIVDIFWNYLNISVFVK